MLVSAALGVDLLLSTLQVGQREVFEGLGRGQG